MKQYSKGMIIEFIGLTIGVIGANIFGTINNPTDNQIYGLGVTILGLVVAGFGIGWVFYPEKENVPNS